MFAIVLLLLTQVACAPQEGTAVCGCKQGSASACEALRQTDAALADKLEAAVQVVVKVEEERKAAEATQAETEANLTASEPPFCKGQLHHIISRIIAKALRFHQTLSGHYKARDPRFVARAADEKSHCGYQDWHRKVDSEVSNWLRENENATPEQFENLLREIYSRTAMRARFPNGF